MKFFWKIGSPEEGPFSSPLVKFLQFPVRWLCQKLPKPHVTIVHTKCTAMYVQSSLCNILRISLILVKLCKIQALDRFFSPSLANS